MKRLRLEAGQASYPVLVGPGALSRLSRPSGRVAVVVDETVERLHGARIRACLAGVRAEFTTVPSGERHKTLRTVELLYDWLAERRIERGEPIVAVGGGVTGDVVGFAAATWRRGVPLVQAPTTLLAQVDSGVGGKVAVDHREGKNLVGAFHQPVEVLADTDFLATLPARERRAGLAEVVKTALLAGDPLLSIVDRGLEAMLEGGDVVEDAIADCIAYKAAVVQRDPEEHGERAVLNLGHTVGHALERVCGAGVLLHGEAVAHGLKVALALSGVPSGSPLPRLVARLDVPAPPGPPSVDALLDAMRHDKKVRGGQVRFVLLDGPGCPHWDCEVPPDEVRRAVEALVEGRL